MSNPTNFLRVMSGLALLLPLLFFLVDTVGSSQRFSEDSGWVEGVGSHTRLWKGSNSPSSQQDGRLLFQLEDDYFDNTDPYVMGGSEDVPVHRPFIPFDPLTSLPGVIRRPVQFERNAQPNPNSQSDVNKPRESSKSSTHRRPHVAPDDDDDTSWRWPSDTVRPEHKHTTRPATQSPEKSVTHVQVFLTPSEVPSVRQTAVVIPPSHHVVSSQQDGEVNYLNRQVGESAEDVAVSGHHQQQSHESTQVHVVESVVVQPERPASSEEVYGISGELSTLDHMAKTTPMQNGLAKEGGNGGDSIEQPTTTAGNKITSNSKRADTTLPTTSNVHTSVLSSVGMIIQQSAGHTTKTTSTEVQSTHAHSKATNAFNNTTKESLLHTIRPPIYRTAGLSEVTHYNPSSVSTDKVDVTNSNHDQSTKVTDSSKHPNNSNANTQAMTVVTQKSITISTSDDGSSHEITDGSEETGTTSDILGVRVKFTMSGEDARFKTTEDSAEVEATDRVANNNAPTIDSKHSTLQRFSTTISSTELPALKAQTFSNSSPPSTVATIVASSRITNAKPTINTVTRVSTTSVLTSFTPRNISTTSENKIHSSTTPKITRASPPTTTTIPNTVPHISTESIVTVTSTEPTTTNGVANITETNRITSSNPTTTRQGKAIAISGGNSIGNGRLHHYVVTRLPNNNNTMEVLNATRFIFNFPTPKFTSEAPAVSSTVYPSDFTSQTVGHSSSENTVVTVTAQDIAPQLDNKIPSIHENMSSISTSISDSPTTPVLPTISIANTTVQITQQTETPIINETTPTNIPTSVNSSEATSPKLKNVRATTPRTVKPSSTRRTMIRSRLSTHVNRPFILPTAPSVLDDPNVRAKLLLSSGSSETMDPSVLENFSLPTAPSVITDPTVERATIRHRLRRPQLMRTTPGSLWRPTMRSRTYTATLPAITPYPTRSTTSPRPDLHETMAPPVIQQDDNHKDNRELEPPDIHKFFEDKDAEDTTVITPEATNTIIISSVIGGCAILFFFFLMIFCMCKQKKLRRARYRQPPPSDYANVFVGKYS